MSKELEERLAERRFWSHVDKRSADACWPWMGKLNHDGYGLFYRHGRWRAHRFALHLSGVEIESGLVVDHVCRKRSCVNPAHLRVVTTGENTLAPGSQAISAINATKTHCSKGHPFVPANVRLKKKPYGGFERQCRLCHIQYVRGTKAKRALAALSEDTSHEG